MDGIVRMITVAMDVDVDVDGLRNEQMSGDKQKENNNKEPCRRCQIGLGLLEQQCVDMVLRNGILQPSCPVQFDSVDCNPEAVDRRWRLMRPQSCGLAIKSLVTR
jgi:hypothetical protein